MPQKRLSTRPLARGSSAPFASRLRDQGLGSAPSPLHHIVAAQQFDPATLDYLFHLADRMEKVAARGGNDQCHNRIMATLFYEPSTRTRFSFETAMLRLRGRVISTEINFVVVEKARQQGLAAGKESKDMATCPVVAREKRFLLADGQEKGL